MNGYNTTTKKKKNEKIDLNSFESSGLFISHEEDVCGIRTNDNLIFHFHPWILPIEFSTGRIMKNARRLEVEIL